MNDRRKQVVHRLGIVNAISVSMVILMICGLILRTGLIQGIDPTIDAQRAAVGVTEEKRQIYEGIIFDRNGYQLTEVSEKGKPAQIVSPEANSYLLGMNSDIYGLSGLRARYQEELFDGGKDDHGADLTLTLDSSLQDYCYNLLGQREGCIIVMNAKTGELLAITSRSSKTVPFNANIVDEVISGEGEDVVRKYTEYSESGEAFFLNRAVMTQDPPGSTMKIITAAALIENDQDDFTLDDNDGYIEVSGQRIHNYGRAAYGSGITLEKALNNSINVYFVSAAVNRLGAEAFRTMTNSFLYNQDINLDFTTLTSVCEVNTVSELAGAGYGQGKTAISPLHVCMIMAAELNDGVMMKPYLVKSIQNDGKFRYKGEEEKLTRCMKKNTAKTLGKYLHSTAVKYGFCEENDDYYTLAKTGTADDRYGTNHVYCLAGEGDYAILVSINRTSSTSSEAKPLMSQLLEHMRTMYP